MADSEQAWKSWGVQEWNKRLLRFCFVDDADAPPHQGLRASEEDLLEVTGDRTSKPRTMAERLVEELRREAERRYSTPAAFALTHQMKRYTLSRLEEPPFFAFLWLTCLIAHGYPDPEQEGKFHARYEAVFGRREDQKLGFLTEAWEKLRQWSATEGIFEDRPHRRLELPPIQDYRRKISHSWWLSFPSLKDCRVVEKRLRQVQERHGWQLKANSPELIRSLEAEKNFSSDFMRALKKYQKELAENREAETSFGSFLDRVIQSARPRKIFGPLARSSKVFGPLVLCPYGDVLGVLLLAEGIPNSERDGWHGEPGHEWCEKLSEHTLLVPDNSDPEDAAFEGGRLAIDGTQSQFAILRPFIDRGLLLFGLDTNLNCPRLLLSFSAEQKPSHAVVSEDNYEAFCNKFGGRIIDFDCDEEGWTCIKGFEATAKQLKAFSTSGVSPDHKNPLPKLTLSEGFRVQGGWLGRGLGLPSVRVQFREPPQNVELFLPQEKEGTAYAQDRVNQEIWNPSEHSRKKTAFPEGEAKLVASFADSTTRERIFQLRHIPSRVQFKRSQKPIVCREDWGCELGPIDLETPKQSSNYDLDDCSIRAARQWLNNEKNPKARVDLSFEQQMLDALCARFQRRPSIRRQDFRQIYRQLGGMSDEWPLFYEGLLRGWCEGGWLEEGMNRDGQWTLQPVDPRLVQTGPKDAQVVGLLSVAGLERLLALAIALEVKAEPVPPACPRLPRGWRFHGEVGLLAEFSGLPLAAQEAWVKLPVDWGDETPWLVIHKEECDGPEWPRSARDRDSCQERLCGERKGSHLDHSQPPKPRCRWDDKAGTSAVIHREHGFGRIRWHSPDDGHGPFVSCHRNRAALHSIHGASNGLWPFGFCNTQHIERFYDADAYLPLPLGRLAALKGRELPGPTLPRCSELHIYRYEGGGVVKTFRPRLPCDPKLHTYSYWLDRETSGKLREQGIPLINGL